MSNLINFTTPNLIPVNGVLVVVGDLTHPGTRFNARFSSTWRPCKGSTDVYYLFDRQDKVQFTYRDGEIAAYPDISRSEFRESWEGGKALLHSNAVYFKVDEPDFRSISLIMELLGIEL